MRSAPHLFIDNGANIGYNYCKREVLYMKAKDLTGKRFGKLVVVSRFPENAKNGKSRWLCKCDCGKESIVVGTQLTR